MRLHTHGCYPADWPQIARQTKDAAGNRCIRCKHPHDAGAGRTLNLRMITGVFGITSGTAQVLETPAPPLTNRPELAGDRLMPQSTRSPKELKLGRAKCRWLYPDIGACESCGEPAVDRHHKDGDTWNNNRSNLMFLCRRCHLDIDPKFVAKECINCGRVTKPLRRGHCHTCNEYLRRHGVDRPYTDDGRTEKLGELLPCAVCGDSRGRAIGSSGRPARRSGARFGIEGQICVRCFGRLYWRQRNAR